MRTYIDEAGVFVPPRDGLQLADMLAVILRRALSGRLQPPGWEHFGRLIAGEERSPFLQLRLAGPAVETRLGGRAVAVWERLVPETKPMRAPEGG